MSADDAIPPEGLSPEAATPAQSDSFWASWMTLGSFWRSSAANPHPIVDEDRISYYEQRILSKLATPFRQYMVAIQIDGAPYEINTIETLPDESDDVCKYPLVLIHGFAGGIGIFVKNLDALAQKYKVYAFDGLGWGKSSRPDFPKDSDAAEALFVEAIEQWRAALNIDKMVLLGHSFGGYQAAAYALVHPQHVQHLILADPWGFPSKPAVITRQPPLWARAIIAVLRPFSPLALLRAFGSYAPSVLARIRPDLARKFSDTLENNLLYEYIYHLNAKPPSAELGFLHLVNVFRWARRPMIERIGNLDSNVPITFIYGAHTWMDISVGELTRALRPDSHVDVQIVPGAGHHVYVDQHDEFNRLVQQIATMVSDAATADVELSQSVAQALADAVTEGTAPPVSAPAADAALATPGANAVAGGLEADG
eukprot:m.29204 g.29204  ORF g.29204 m.29204 type:complete len:425 (+) comp4638_c0_seq1:87-1361(+)